MAFEKKEKKQNTLRVMPNSFEAEQAVLGGIISDNDIALEFVSEIVEDDFYTTAHKTIFNEISNLRSVGKPIDIIILVNVLEQKGKLAEVGGVSMLSQLADSIPSVANIQYYLNIIKQKALLRRIIRTCNDVITNAYDMEDADKALSYAEAKIFEISQNKIEKSELRPLADIATEVFNTYAEVYQTRQPKTGLKVGLNNLDELTNGFLPGQMVVVAARPGCGKTSFCMQIISNICQFQSEKVVACFNLEMSDNEIAQRVIANVTQTPSRDFIEGNVTPEDLQKLWASGAVFDKSRVYVDDSAQITAEQIMSKCRKLKLQKGRLDLVIIDYLQLMDSMKKSNKYSEVSDTSRAIKIMAKELGVPIILLSQMSRGIETRDDKTPKLSDLRESGAIEQDADIVMFLSEGDFELFNAEGTPIYLHVAKNRNGSVADLAFRWNKATMTYNPVLNIVVRADKEENNQNSNETKNNNQNNAIAPPPSQDRYSDSQVLQGITDDFEQVLESVPVPEPSSEIYDDLAQEIQMSDIPMKPKRE